MTRAPLVTLGNRQSAMGNPLPAFTLVELVVAMGIVAIILAVGAVRFARSSLALSEATRVARRLVADLRYAQSEAITQTRNHYLRFTRGGGKFIAYAIYRVEAGGDVQLEPTRILPDTVAVTGSVDRAEFAPGGDALAPYAYTVTAPGRTYNIQVTLATGAVTLTEP